MEDKLLEKVEEKIQHIIDSDINTGNLDNLYKLSKIKHMTKEDKQMYRDYNGRSAGYDNYGRDYYRNYGNDYGRRGRDMRYRGEEELDRMHGEYGNYQESRRYGAPDETDKSFHYMVKALEDFIKVLHEEAETQQQKQMLKDALQRSMM